MDSFFSLGQGLLVAMQPKMLLYAAIGCIFGTLVGVLPGFGPSAGTALLIPLTFSLDATGAIVMLTAIYYGAMYGGTITSVLINTPGEAASAVTCIDGHAMARQGRAGAALSIAAIGSFAGGIAAGLLLVFAGPRLASFALAFGPPEFFALMVFGLSLVIGLAGSSLTRALISAGLGLLLAMIGIDPVAGAPRFTFGVTELLDGVNFVSVIMGLYGVSEVLLAVERSEALSMIKSRLRLMPERKDMRDSAIPIVRGAAIGTFFGFVPGVGAVVPAFISYVVEKRISRTPEKFGQGMIAGVAAPETANNAYVIAALIPLFTLGIPGSATIAILMGAFMINGIAPGPLLFTQHPDLIWGVIGSLFVGNIMLLLLNLPCIPLWVAILRLPAAMLHTAILGFCIVGSYTLENNVFDVGIMLAAGILGYLMQKADVPLAPMVLTLILGPMMEQNLRLTLELFQGEASILFHRPLSVLILGIAAAFLIATVFAGLRPVRQADSEV